MPGSFEDLKFRDCYVNQVGPIENGATIVLLTETGGEFTEVWFSAYEPISQEVLQTALVAVQGNLVCNVALTDTKADSEIYRIQSLPPGWKQELSNKAGRPAAPSVSAGR